MESVTIKPDMRIVHSVYGDITEEVARELAKIRREDHARLVAQAERRQAALARARTEPLRHTQDLRLKAEIDPAIHAHWRMRCGPGFWRHELDWFLRRHPECRVDSRRRHLTLAMPGRLTTAHCPLPKTTDYALRALPNCAA